MGQLLKIQLREISKLFSRSFDLLVLFFAGIYASLWVYFFGKIQTWENLKWDFRTAKKETKNEKEFFSPRQQTVF